MHVDVAVRTVPGAQAAADTMILDPDLQRVMAVDRVHGTPDQAIGVRA